MYNYYDAIKNDIRDYLGDHSSRDYDKLYEDLWIEDSVTGNASGSYTFSTADAEEYVKDNMDLVREACKEFCVDSDSVSEHFMDEDWEWFDVTIRCYLLGECLDDVLREGV